MVLTTTNALTRFAALLTMVLLVVAARALSADAAADPAFEEVAAWDADKPAKCLRTVEMIVGHALPDAAARRQVADRLAGMLAEPKLSLAARNFVCGQLAFAGDEKDVPVLAKMVAAADTADMARRALAMIPGEASGKVLREAVGTLKGTALAGLVASLGERRDAAAVEAIGKCLEGADEQVFAAAVVALG